MLATFFLLLVFPTSAHPTASFTEEDDTFDIPTLKPAAAAAGATEHLNFLSATLGSHMVLQQAPKQAVVWGHTAPGATVTTTMMMTTTMTQVEGRRQTFTTTAEVDGTWRQSLPPVSASKTPYSFTFASSNSTSERAQLDDVLFGEVYICGGQSNMEFALPAVTNATFEIQKANAFPTIRIFSVGHRTQSKTPLRDLQTVWEPWQVASNKTIAEDFVPGHTLFSTFSAVCWLFGQELSQQLSPTGDVPLGLISNNWGGTKLEVWTPASAFGACNRTGEPPPMYNAMILPYAQGPMALAGFTWYQGEANTASAESAADYGCLFPQMIDAWRQAFAAPNAFFGFVQLSTWCSIAAPESLPQMREAQMTALALPNVGYATNADHGMGCIIHPANKKVCSRRLAKAALAIVYNKTTAADWRSPTYQSATQLRPYHTDTDRNGKTTVVDVQLRVTLSDLSASGLFLQTPFNYESPGYQRQAPHPINCSGTSVVYPKVQMATQCAWASLHVATVGWVNATVSVDSGRGNGGSGGQALILSATVPVTATAAVGIRGSGSDGNSKSLMLSPTILGSAMGWGPIPMISAYDRGSQLPVLPWNRSVSGGSLGPR